MTNPETRSRAIRSILYFILLAWALAPLARAASMQAAESRPDADETEKSNITVSGFAEGSFNYNFARPGSGRNDARLFDSKESRAVANQLDLAIERAAVIAPHFDWGFRAEAMFGHDAGLVHSNGLFDNHRGPFNPEYQFDLLQLYGDIVVGAGDGVRIRAGKFLSPICYETISPLTRPFYTTSFLYSFATPFTHTGIRFTAPVSSEWTVDAAVVRGWEQSIEDNNKEPALLAGATWASADGKTTVATTLLTGREAESNNHDTRTILDLVGTHAASEIFTFAVSADYATEESAAAGSREARWYGIAGYASCNASKITTINFRGEWFRDDGGTRTGIDANYYEFTSGVTLRPFTTDKGSSWLTIRPELRVDFADSPAFRNGRDDSQFTFAIDVIISF